MTIKSRNKKHKLQDFGRIVSPKHYARVIWSMCVLGNK